VSVSAPVPQRLVDSIDESTVAAYLKDPDGRYLHVNRRFEEVFQIGANEVRGREDEELAPGQTIDGPRLASGSISENEPLQLEYTVAPFEGRPALAVWRFAVRGTLGETVALCAVAAPVIESVAARRECERLMTVAETENTAEEAAPLTEEPSATPSDAHQIAALHEASAEAARRAHELLAELTSERERRAEAESRAADGDQLRRRVEAAEAAVLAERERSGETDAAAQRERARADAADAAVLAERSRAEEAGVTAQRERARADEAQAELTAARADVEGLRAELEQRAHTEQELVTDLHRKLEDATAAAETERARAGESRTGLDAVRAELESTRSELESARSELASEREERSHTEHEVVADLRSRLDDALAQLESMRSELVSEREERSHTEHEVVVDLARRLEDAMAAAELERAEAAEAHAAARAERARVEEAGAQLNAARAELDAAHADLASEQARGQQSQDEAEIIGELRRQLDAAVAESAATRAQLETGPGEELVADLRRQLADTMAAIQQQRARAEDAEAAVVAQRADAEIRVSVADRRIAELESALAVSRARELEDAGEHGSGGPHWDSSAQRAFTTALAQSSDWRVAIKSAIGVLGEQGGWNAVCAWQPDDRHGFASCFAMWTGENRRLSSLETATWQRRQPLTGSTIGEALTWRESRWLSADPEAGDRRLQLLAQHGLRGALIVPIRDGVQPVAALELLSVAPTPPSSELTDAIETIALQIGHFWHLLSAGAQPRWRFGRV
jgi:hypothetical protein